MKTIFLLSMTLGLSIAQNPEAELFVYYNNGPSDEWVIIFPFQNTRLFDKHLRPLPLTIRADFGDPQLYLNACYQGQGEYGQTNPASTNGTVFYGKYEIQFGQRINNEWIPTQGLSRFIDFRDDEYGWNLAGTAIDGSVDGYSNQDFFVVCLYNSSNPSASTIRFSSVSASNTGQTGSGYGIWELGSKTEPGATQGAHTTRFRNFKATLIGNESNTPAAFTVNGNTYQIPYNGTLETGLGFSSPTALISTSNRLRLATQSSLYQHVNFVRWVGGPALDTTWSLPFGSLAVHPVAIYKWSNQWQKILGQSEFGSTAPLAFTSDHKIVASQGYQYEWYIKWDYVGSWQYLGNTKTVNVTPSYTPTNAFTLKCYLRDYHDTVAVWSNEHRVSYAPPVSASISGPTTCIAQFSTVTWYANVSGGNGAYTYQWKKDNTVVGTGPSVTLQVPGGFRLHLTVTSTYGAQTYSTYKDISTSGCGGGGGCPFVFIESDTGVVQDNNILNRSEFEDNVGVDIVDRYRLNVKPSLNSGQYRLSIQELNDDHSYFDAFRLYAVDHPEGTDIGITENNDIVLLYPSYVESASEGRMKDQDLTSAITFKEAFGLRGQKSDTLRLKFKQDSERIRHWSSVRSSHRRDSLAFLAKVGDVGTNALPGPKDEFAFVSDGSSSYSLSGRESSSSLILPIASIPDAMTIVWNRDYTVRDIGLTRVFYDGFIQRELPLAEAVHSHKGKIRRDLSDADGKYGEL